MTKNKIKAPSEADYEGRVRRVLMEVFPTWEKVKVIQQETFSINVGRRNIKIENRLPDLDKENAKVYASYDILLTVNDKNAILLELKKEDAKIKQEHIDQGLSYGRLIHPMPPITVIAGKDIRIYDTFTREEIEKDIIDSDFIISLINKSAELAKEDLNEAIGVLMNRNPKVFSNVINATSEQNFKFLIGNVTDLKKPISTDFKIKRKITRKIYECSNNKNLIGLIGGAFSGKTNIFHDIYKEYKNGNTAIFYLDLEELQYSIFKKLAHLFTQELDFYINEDKVLEWLNITIRRMENFKLIFLFDNYNDDLPDKIKSNFQELIDLTDNTKHSVIFSIDEINYNRITKKKHRNYETFLSKVEKFNMKVLDTEEYYEMQKLLFDKFQTSIQYGGHVTKEYRIPRVIRLLAFLLEKDEFEIPKNQFHILPSIPNIQLLNSLCEIFFISTLKNEKRQILKKLSEVYADYELSKLNNSSLKLATISEGALPKKLLEAKFTDKELNELLESGLVTEKLLLNDLKVIIPKTPEILSYYGIKYITRIILLTSKETQEIKKVSELFINLCHLFEYSDIVGVGVLFELDKIKEYTLFSDLINELLSHSYESNQINDGTILRMYVPEKGMIDFNLDEISKEERGYFINDNLPYLILSQLVANPLATDRDIESGKTENIYDFHLSLLWKIASYEGILSRTENRNLNEMVEFRSRYIDGQGVIISSDMGVVEPIVQSIQNNFSIIPNEIERLYRGAIVEKNYLLLWRIYIALKDYKNSVNQVLSDKAKLFLLEYKPFFAKWMNSIIFQNDKNPIEEEKLKKFIEEMEF